MSLRVWLPLNGSLKNQGLDKVTVTNNGATINDNGKIGKCYSFDGSDDYISLGSSVGKYFNGSPFSITFWIRSEEDGTRGIIFSAYGLSSTSNFFALEVNGSSGTMDNYLRFDWLGADIKFFQGAITPNVWLHFAITYNGSKITCYRNGEFYGDVTRTLSSIPTGNSYYLGRDSRTGATAFKGKLNDFRLYDHALSDQEVKKLSQGLILHYPLDRNGWGQDNILLNTHFDSQYSQTSGWDTSKNGTHLASSWGGYNSGVSNQATVYHAHLKKFNGEWVYEYIKTANENWLGISQGGLNTKLVAGNTYTFSWEQYCVSGDNYVQTGLYYYKIGASSANFHLGLIYGNVNRKLGKWQRFSRTFIAPEDGDYSKNMSWYIYGASGNGTVYVRHPKLEIGDKVTLWCSNSADSITTSMRINSNIVKDISGYQNNGTINGTLSYSTNTPKHLISSSFNGSDNAIQTPDLKNMITDKTYTISCWTYKTVIGTKGYQTIYGGPSGFELEARSGSTTTPLFRIHNWGGGTTAYEFDNWYHFCFVHNDENSKLYINGELKLTGSSISIPSGNYFIGAWKTATQQNYDGLISDFRIYCTALSADEVKDLYKDNITD